MAKPKGGLPDDFDIGVTGADLRGPATLPGYLDDAPLLPPRHTPRPVAPPVQTVSPAPDPVRPLQTVVTNDDGPNARQPEIRPPATPAAPIASGRVPPAPPPEIRRRLQVNLDPDSDRMVNELLDLLSGQSAEHRIKVSELFQALLVNLYHARGEIVLGSLPPRGRWGSVTARAFPMALAESVRAAIVVYDRAIGSNPFKKVLEG